MTVIDKKFIAPALSTAPVEYDQRREDQLVYQLRLYFNLLDNYLATLNSLLNNGGPFPYLDVGTLNADIINAVNIAATSGSFEELKGVTNYLDGIINRQMVSNSIMVQDVYGGRLHGDGATISNPYVSATDSTTQYLSADNTATVVTWSALECGDGFTLNVDNSATCNKTGVYKIDYSLQLANNDNAAHDVDVWLKTDGSLVSNSTTRFTIPARKSAGISSYICAYSHVTFSINAGDKIYLYWASDLAATSGGALGVYMPAFAASNSPYVRPAIPSAIGTIAFISRSNASVPSFNRTDVVPVPVVGFGNLGDIVVSTNRT